MQQRRRAPWPVCLLHEIGECQMNCFVVFLKPFDPSLSHYDREMLFGWAVRQGENWFRLVANWHSGVAAFEAVDFSAGSLDTRTTLDALRHVEQWRASRNGRRC